MIELFKQRSPASIAFLFLFGVLIKLPLFLFARVAVATQNDEDLYHLLVSTLGLSHENNAVICSVISFTLLLIQAFMINYVINEYRMTPRQTYLPAMAFLLVTSLFPEWNYLSSPLIASTLILWAFTLLFRLYNLSVTRGSVYNIGLIIGISSYVYFPSAAFIICIVLGILILIPFRLNEIILLLMGGLTPYYFYGAYLFLDDRFSVQNFVPHVSVRVPDIRSSIQLAISTILLAVPFLTGGYFVQRHMGKMLIQVRKNWSILLLYILLAFFVPFINSNDSFNNWILVAAPFAAFHSSAYYYPAKKWLPLGLFIVTSGFILYQQYFGGNWR